MPVEEVALRFGARWVLTKIQSWVNANNEQLRKDTDEAVAEWAAAAHQAANTEIPRLEARFEDLEGHVRAFFEDRQSRRIYANLGFEAAREALDERRRMLAYASIGLLAPGLSLERKARVERTLRELDPGDVRVLHSISRSIGLISLNGKHINRVAGEAGLRADLVRAMRGAGDTLVASGCVRVSYHSGAGASWSEAWLTERGWDVLEVLDGYLLSRGSAFDEPGRERGSADRSEETIRKLLSAAPQVIELATLSRRLAWHVQRRYEHKRSSADACLEFSVVLRTLIMAKPLHDAFKRVEADTGLPDVSAQREDASPMIVLRLRGPHDLLRWLAEEAGAQWHIPGEP
jgi:hypothetical protein